MASPEEIMTDENHILEYIPQRPPMVMVGKLICAEGRKTTTSFLVSEDNLFCENKIFTEAGIIENIAQTAAAGAGYRSLLKNETPPPGFIGAIKSLVIHSLPVAGDLLITEVSVDHEVFDATVITGRTTVDSRLIAECEMKIFLRKSNL
jgi:3-hydroxymyristoyl/3-hydroxydecanoyl-(acyl carrier protein) dehydratase